MTIIVSEIATWAICLLVGICVIYLAAEAQRLKTDHDDTGPAVMAVLALLLLIALIIIARYGRLA
jgi:hypothetical protein